MGESIGRYIRSRSLSVLQETFKRGNRVVDLGCGTGVEAEAMVKNGIEMVGIDISKDMLAIARKRLPDTNFYRLPIGRAGDLVKIHKEKKFDGAYSSLGAFNCEPALSKAFREVAGILRPRGSLVVSVMNRYPVFEVVMMLMALRFRRASERMLKEQRVALGSENITVSYPSASELIDTAGEMFNVQKVKALPLFVPPVRFQNLYNNVPFASVMEGIDRKMAEVRPFNRLGDHILLVLKLKN